MVVHLFDVGIDGGGLAYCWKVDELPGPVKDDRLVFNVGMDGDIGAEVLDGEWTVGLGCGSFGMRQASDELGEALRNAAGFGAVGVGDNLIAQTPEGLACRIAGIGQAGDR